MNTRYVRNPDDGTATYTQIELYRAVSKGGTYTLISTTAIDLTTALQSYYGYTKIADSTGDANSWYKWRFKNGSSFSNYSEEMQAEMTEFDMKVRRRMHDDDNNKYFFSDRDIQDASDLAVKSLWPATYIDETYDVLITDSNKLVIVLPSYISRPDNIKVYDSAGSFCGDYVAFYRVGLKIYALDSFPTGYTFRFSVSKKYKLLAETPDDYEPYLLDKAELELLKTMETDRARYYKYTTTIRPEGGNMPSLSKIIERLEVTIRAERNELRRVREVAEINLV